VAQFVYGSCVSLSGAGVKAEDIQLSTSPSGYPLQQQGFICHTLKSISYIQQPFWISVATLKGARYARSLDSPEFPRWMQLSDGERSASVAPAQEAERILLNERF
jgi:hypothetical protein